MSLDQLNVIDVAGISKADDAAVLTLFDSWDWSDQHEHLLALQEKFNCYLEFIETGQIFEDYPAAQSRKLRIEIVHRFKPPPIAVRFFEAAQSVAAQLNIDVTQTHWPGKAQ